MRLKLYDEHRGQLVTFAHARGSAVTAPQQPRLADAVGATKQRATA